ncbi:hypothetical protein CspeluHIS016_0110100 [Cutaneotrichosporon spelunceum]|uniref:Uncharacterized protein n=1 Tax=Cutaneotrichosporon spelunceum TaxID=1672016 RepID=A0AAD3TPS1_9TREE|nr:hypothetical protein CspeluHIS016_0110100 [Cutaneotrichosporon spelunceum]
MSRRREEAELQRVLQLSTQQARTFVALPPYTLSSAPTDDSRDMELRPVNPQSTGDTLMTPHRSAPKTSSYLLSPDPEERNRREPPLANVPTGQFDIVVPARLSHRQRSPDPIDALEPSEHLEYNNIRYGLADDIPEGNGFALEPIGDDGAVAADATLLGPNSAESGDVVTRPGEVSSSGVESSRRSSAGKQNATEKQVPDAAEKKRKRVGRKAKQAAADAITEAYVEAPALPAAPPPKRKAKKAKVPKAGSSQSTARSISQRSGQDESAPPFPTSSYSEHDARNDTQNPSESATAAGSAMTVPGDAVPDVSGGAPEVTVECSKSSMTNSVISSAEPRLTAAHSSPSKSNPGSPIRSSPDALRNDSSSPVSAVTPQVARVLRPTHHTPPAGSSTPGGGQWRTPRNDLAGVLAKFPGARRTGMSKRINIVPLHVSIGPGVKSLPPPPPKSKKRVDEDDNEDEDDENGNPKIKVGSREWLMMED